MPLDHGLDLRLFMLRDDAEVRRLCANPLVLGDGHHHRLRTAPKPAFASEIHRPSRGCRLVVGGALCHPLVAISEECLVPGQAFLPNSPPGALSAFASVVAS